VTVPDLPATGCQHRPAGLSCGRWRVTQRRHRGYYFWRDANNEVFVKRADEDFIYGVATADLSRMPDFESDWDSVTGNLEF